MSTLAKSVFAASCVITLGTAGYVHYQQVLDRHNLRLGIVKEIERQERKRENVENLQAQIELTKRYEEVMAEKHTELKSH